MHIATYTGTYILVHLYIHEKDLKRQGCSGHCKEVVPSAKVFGLSSECAHVSILSIAEVACYRLERTLMGCRGSHYGIRGSISVLELTKNEVVGGSYEVTGLEHGFGTKWCA